MSSYTSSTQSLLRSMILIPTKEQLAHLCLPAYAKNAPKMHSHQHFCPRPVTNYGDNKVLSSSSNRNEMGRLISRNHRWGIKSPPCSLASLLGWHIIQHDFLTEIPCFPPFTVQHDSIFQDYKQASSDETTSPLLF
jgi:hypothetical protein